MSNSNKPINVIQSPKLANQLIFNDALVLLTIILIKARKFWSFDKARTVLMYTRHMDGEKNISKLQSLCLDQVSGSSEFVRNVFYNYSVETSVW